MGPFEHIGSASKKPNGLKRSNQQQHPPMQWAHLSASAVPPRNILGQNKAIGSSIHQCNRPIRMCQEYLTEVYWTKAKHSAAASSNAMWPSRAPPRSLMVPSEAIVRSIR